MFAAAESLITFTSQHPSLSIEMRSSNPTFAVLSGNLFQARRTIDNPFLAQPQHGSALDHILHTKVRTYFPGQGPQISSELEGPLIDEQ